MQSKCCQDDKDANNLDPQSPCMSGLKTKVGEKDRLQDQNCNHEENEEGEIPGASRAAGMPLLVIATYESEVHRVEYQDGEQRRGGLWDSEQHNLICGQPLGDSRGDACHGDNGVIRIFEMKPQPAFDIVGPCAKADQTNVVFKSFLQGGVKQNEISTRDIIF